MDPYIKEYENEPIKSYHFNNVLHLNTACKTAQYNFNIFHINIRSISKNIDELSVFLSQFYTEFEMIILTETFQIHDKNIFNIKGYNMLYNEGNLNKNDGVVVFIKASLNYSYDIINIGEVKAIKVTVIKENKKIIITSVYRSPTTSIKLFNLGLLAYLKIIEKNDMHIITGDMNIDILSSSDHVEEYKNILNSYGLISYINDYTRPQSKTCLDHFFINSRIHKNENDIKPIIFEQNITDHYPIIILCRINSYKNRSRNDNQTDTKIHKKFINYDNLRSDLREEYWSDIYEQDDVDLVANKFINKLKYYIYKNTRTITIKNKNKKRKEWITQGLIKSTITKNEMYKKLSENPNNKLLETQYKTYRNKLTQLIKNAKTKYYGSIISKNKNVSKNLWNCVNNICNKHKPRTIIDQIKLTDGTIVSNKVDISNKFNEHYSDLGENYAKKITAPDKFTENNKILENTMYLYPTNETEVIKVIRQLKPKKSPGDDGIRSETLKEISSEIVSPVMYLINKCFDTGRFPELLKIGMIKPLHKGGDKLEIINYRPISLISNVAKIIEKIIKCRLINFLNKYKLISDHQYGFREGKSTEDAIHYLTSYIYNNLDKKTPTLCVFIDLAKAFDTVCHRKLLEKLECYGIRGNTFNLIKSYLSDRKQHVNIDDTISSFRQVKYGVPQGTVLGPVLFTIYINSLLSFSTTGTILSFADDTAILYEADSWHNLKEKVEKDLKQIKHWFQYNKLTLNCEKTKYLPFTSYSNHLPNMGSLIIDSETQIPEATSMKYLGIVIDRHLRWDLQIQNIIKKLRGLLPRFKYLKGILNETHLRTIYYALVQSQLSYGIVGWGGVSDIYLENLNVIQKWILKIIYGKCFTYSSDDLFLESKLLDVRQLFCFNTIMNIFKHKIPVEHITHNYQTRHKQNNSNVPRCEKTIGQRHCNYLGPKLYNMLPNEFKNIDSLNLFKSKIKKWLLTTPRNIFHKIINQSTR